MNPYLAKFLKALTGCLLFAEALGCVLLAYFCALGLFPALADAQLGAGEKYGVGIVISALVLELGIAAALARLGWRAGLRDPLRACLPLFALAPVVVYLAHDEAPDRHRLSTVVLGEMRPADAAEQTWLRRWSGPWFEEDTNLTSDYRSPKTSGLDGIDPKSPDAGARLALARAELEAAWTELAPARAWWAELAERPVPGAYRVDGKPVKLPWASTRDLAKYGFMRARLLAHEGHGEAALNQAGEILSGVAKLEQIVGDPGRIFTCRRITALGLPVIEAILAEAGGTLPVETREHLAAELASGAGGEAGFRRAVASEALLHGTVFPGASETTGVASLFFNPQATANAMDGLLERIMEAGARRDTETIRAINRGFIAEARRSRGPKNVMFWRGFAQTWTEVTFLKMSREYWEQEDRRAALAARLRGAESSATATKEGAQ